MRSSQNIFHFLFLGCLIAASIGTWNGIHGPLVLDDFQNLSPLLDTEKPDYPDVILSNESGPLGRSVSMASFAFNHWIRGSLKSEDLKLTNLLIHLLNAVLLYFMLMPLLGRHYDKNQRNLLALTIASCWLLSPVNTGVIFYAVQRMALLSTFFTLLACLIYVYFRPVFTSNRRKSFIAACLVSVCWLLAMFSKENGILLPVFILCIELCFFKGLRLWISELSGPGKITCFSSLLALCGLSLLLTAYKGNLDYSYMDFTLSSRLYTQPVVLMDYLYKMALPVNMDLNLYSDEIAVQTTFWNWKSVFSSLFLMACGCIGVYAFVKNKGLYFAFGILFFLLGHSLESTIFPLEMYFIHRNYLPSIGFYFFLCLFLYTLMCRTGMSRLYIPTMAIYLCLFMYFSHGKSDAWSSEEKVIENSYYYHPYSSRVNLTMVEWLRKTGKLERALEVNSAILESGTADVFPSMVQRIYLYCRAGLVLPEFEYTRFSNSISRNRALESANALQHLLDIYNANQCEGVNITAIMLGLSQWLDDRWTAQQYSPEQLWHLEYYLIEFALVTGNGELADQGLKRLAAAGDVAALEHYQDRIKKPE